jgi:hypothetical protein
MGMSRPCKWRLSISVGDEPLARSGLKSIERHYRRGKDFSAARCKNWEWKLKLWAQLGIFAIKK